MYNGVKEITLDDQQLAKFYENKLEFADLVQNQYLLIKDVNGDYIDKYKWDKNKLVKVKSKTIDNSYIGKIKPLNIKQECFFDLLDSDVPVKVVSGIAGSGKTFVSTAWALQEIQKEKYKKFIVVRNNINVQDVPELGAMPGDLNDKLRGFSAFISDIVSDYTYDMLLQKNILELAYLGTMRGRSLSDAIILVSEAQNLTKNLVRMLITRVAKNSVIIFDFDLDQIDKKSFEKDNGMTAMLDSLQGNLLFGAMEFDRIERSEVARLAELIK